MSYKVLSNIKVDGEIKAPGTVIEFPDEAEANELVADGVLELVEDSAAEVDQKQPPLVDPADTPVAPTEQSPTPPQQPSPPTPPQPSQAGQIPTPNGVTHEQVLAALEGTEGSSTQSNNEQAS